jgi:hypothetical protein
VFKLNYYISNVVHSHLGETTDELLEEAQKITNSKGGSPYEIVDSEGNTVMNAKKIALSTLRRNRKNETKKKDSEEDRKA